MINSITYDEAEDKYCATFDPEEVLPSEAVIMTLAEITETDPFELDLLNRHIDPEALNMLLSGNRPETANGTREVTFEYEDHTVTATSSGALTIRPRGEEKTP